MGVEPTTCRLRIGCSTTELPRPFNYLREVQTAFCVVLALFETCCNERQRDANLEGQDLVLKPLRFRLSSTSILTQALNDSRRKFFMSNTGPILLRMRAFHSYKTPREHALLHQTLPWKRAALHCVLWSGAFTRTSALFEELPTSLVSFERHSQNGA